MRARTVVSGTVTACSDRPTDVSDGRHRDTLRTKPAAYHRQGEIRGRRRSEIKTSPISYEPTRPSKRLKSRRKLQYRAQSRPTELLGTCANRRKRAPVRQLHPRYAVSACVSGNLATHHAIWHAGAAYARQNSRVRHCHRLSRSTNRCIQRTSSGRIQDETGGVSAPR